MRNWARRIRAAAGMGVIWAVIWAVAGIGIGVTSKLLPGLPLDWFFNVFDAPLPALAVPGFIGGILFSVVLGVAGRRRRFEDLSLPRFAAWGALGGLLVTLFPLAMAAVGLATLSPTFRLWPTVAVAGVPMMLLSAVSATVSLVLARKAEARVALAAE